jgi:hypothetical protein
MTPVPQAFVSFVVADASNIDSSQALKGCATGLFKRHEGLKLCPCF